MTEPTPLHGSSQGPVAEDAWRESLALGRAAEAYQHYLSLGTPDETVQESLVAFVELQRELRARSFRRAEQVVARVTDPELVDLESLNMQLEQLRIATQTLDKRDIDAVSPLLDDVTHPLLAAEVATLRGTVSVYDSDTDAAGVHFDRALEVDPRHYRALTNRGNLALEAGDLDEAIRSYEAAIRLEDSFPNAHHNLGVAYRRKGMVAKSVTHIKRAQQVSRRRDTEEARETLGRATRVQGGKWLRWLLYGAGFIVLYLILQSQGILPSP